MYGDNAKYIIVKTNVGIIPVIFPLHMKHNTMSQKFKEVISAGFVNNRLECFGKSDSLGIESKKEDTQMVLDMFGTDKESMNQYI